MLFHEAEEFFKGLLPYQIIIVFSIWLFVIPNNCVNAAYEIPAFRMHQFDVNGVNKGCRSANLNFEVCLLKYWTGGRYCVITRLTDLTADNVRILKERAGGLIVLVPVKHSHNLTMDDRVMVNDAEHFMLSNEFNIPVYFIHESGQMLDIVQKLQYEFAQNNSNDGGDFTMKTVLHTVAGDAFQFISSSNTIKSLTQAKVPIWQGRLPGVTPGSSTVLVVAHYDSLAVAPGLAFGADSNGSGVVLLLELMRMFSTLYGSGKMRSKHSLVFLLTGGGKLNFQGSKKWLEENLDGLDDSLVQNIKFVMCLDSVATTNMAITNSSHISNQSTMYMHVSKPPRENSTTATFFHGLQQAAKPFDRHVTGIHKKINLADDWLAWEHERYSIRRIPAFTISAKKSHREPHGYSLLDTVEFVDIPSLINSAKILADALARFLYDLNYNLFDEQPNANGGKHVGHRGVSEVEIAHWVNVVLAQPRAQQLLLDADHNPLHGRFKEHFRRYVGSIETKTLYAVADKKEPEFVLYDNWQGTLQVYKVKPAVFDLFLTCAIIIYLVLINCILVYFNRFYELACRLTAAGSSGTTQSSKKK